MGFSKDGSLIVSGDGASRVTIWEASSGKKLREMKCSDEVRLYE